MELTSEQKKEIQEQQSQSNYTKRVTSPELEKVLYEVIPVLDHGFIRVIDYMGDDRDRKSTRLNSSHPSRSRMPSSA